jgi:crossover junction endodeoxyribonuclease RuvC
MLILGVDPGSLVTGYGIIEKNGSKSLHVHSGVIKTSSSNTQSKRIWVIHTGLEEIVKKYQPEIMVVESLFHAANSQSLIKLSQVRGAVLLLGESYGMHIVEYAPMEIKKGIAGFGRAEKQQMVYMMKKLLNLPLLKSADEADALAMALYHSNLCWMEKN